MLRAWQSGGRGCLGRGTFERWTEVSGRAGCGTGTSPPGRCPRRRTEPPARPSPPRHSPGGRGGQPRALSRCWQPRGSGGRRRRLLHGTPGPARRPHLRGGGGGGHGGRPQAAAPRAARCRPRAGGGRRRARGEPAPQPRGGAGPGRGQRCCRAGVPPLVPPPRGAGPGAAAAGAASGLAQRPARQACVLPCRQTPSVCASLHAGVLPCTCLSVHASFPADLPHTTGISRVVPPILHCAFMHVPMRIYSEYKQG